MAHSIVNGSRSRGSAVALLAVAIAISPPLSQTALAQAVLEEIVVTARKRDENLQEVPIAITALSGDAIERLGFQSPGQIATQIPNVQFNDEGTIPQFNIRGIQLNDFGDGNEAPVAFYIDEVYKGTLAGQTVGLFDLERVEVLRGPQGTLFGRNTTGGLAHFVTRKPTVEGEGYLSAQLGSFSQTIIEGALSGPLAEAARGRIAAKYNKDDGWQGNTQNSSRFAATDALALRASLEVDLSDSAMLSAMVHYGDQDNVSQGYGLAGTLNPTNRAPCSGSEILAGGCVTAIGEPSNLNPRLANTEQDTLQFKNSTSGGYLRFDWSVGNALEFVSISAVERVDKFFQEDSDASPNPVNNSLRIVTGGAVPLDLPAFLSNYSVESSQFTQEFRLSGDREKLNWVLGAFYYTDGKDPLRFEVPQAEATLGSPTGIGNDASLDTDSWAVFAQTDWWLTDTTNLIVGVRFTEDEKDLTISDSATNPTFVDNEFLSTDSVTWKLGLSWQPAANTNIYGHVSKGFKSGTFRTTFSPPGGAPPVGEEEVLAYEVGAKIDLADWARIYAATFYSDYTDFQSNAVTTINGVPGSFLINVGDADISGSELEFILAPTDNFEAILGIGWLDTEIASSNAAYDGNQLAFSPDTNANGVVRYTFPDVGAGYLTLQATATYTASLFMTPENLPGLAWDSYTMFGARAGWYSANDRYSLEIFSENLGDEDVALGGFGVGSFNYNAYIWAPPRRSGVKFNVNF